MTTRVPTLMAIHHRYLFGSDVVAQFNQANDIEMICRAHQLVMEGYKWHFNETVLTVWSAPNYCYRSPAQRGRFALISHAFIILQMRKCCCYFGTG